MTEDIDSKSLKNIILEDFTYEDYKAFKINYRKYIPTEQSKLTDYSDGIYDFLYEYIRTGKL